MAENRQITVRIESRFPVFIEADANAFGQIFAVMTSDEQVAVLASMAEHMRPHQTQWDHVAIELDMPEHAQTRGALQQALFPEVYAQASRIEELEKALRFYADPEIYKPHPHGPAFDRRDVSYVARLALGEQSNG